MSDDYVGLPLPVVCARIGSKRLPGKLVAKLGGKSMLRQVLRRIKLFGIVAIPEDEKHGPLEAIAKLDGWKVSYGPENDVLLRIILAAKQSNAENIIRITPDNPLVDMDIIIKTWWEFVDSGADYCAMAKLPAGMMVEIIKLKALERLHLMIGTDAFPSKDQDLLEHPTLGFHTKLGSKYFKIHIFNAPKYWQRPYRLTVDEPSDLALMQKIYEVLGPKASLNNVIEWLDANPMIAGINSHIQQAATIGIEFEEKKDAR